MPRSPGHHCSGHHGAAFLISCHLTDSWYGETRHQPPLLCDAMSWAVALSKSDQKPSDGKLIMLFSAGDSAGEFNTYFKVYRCKKLMNGNHFLCPQPHSAMYGVSNLIWHRGDNEIYFGEIPINPVKFPPLLLSRRGAESCVLLKYTIKTGMRVAMPAQLFRCQPLQVIASCCLNVSHLRKMIPSVCVQAQRYS